MPNSRGTCTCNSPTASDSTNYVPDGTKTKCVPEPLTIALVGLGVEVMPTKKLETAYALVTKSGGSPKSGAQVTLILTVVPENGEPIRANNVGSISPNGGSTDSYGKLSFVFTAPTAGGIHTVHAGCVNCTNVAEGTIKVPGCSVDDLTDVKDIPPNDPDVLPLTLDLEDGIDGYSLLSPATQAAEQCLAGRINTVVGPPSTSGYKVTSTIRTLAYQAHLRNVWDKFWELKGKVESDPTIQQSCQTLITKVEGEMGFHLTQNPTIKREQCSASLGRAHCIRSGPAQTDPKHTRNIAFDISSDAVTNFEDSLTPPRTVQEEANTCGLTWGGTFTPIDEVHFVLH
jgi:hypothetical protein